MKNAYKKIESLTLVCVMLFSVMTAVLVLPNQSVRAAAVKPGAFSITNPADDSVYGDYDLVNITWGASTGATKYNVTFNGDSALIQNGTIRYYNLDLSEWTQGSLVINIFSWNASGRTYATNNNITIYNNLIPGVTGWGSSTEILNVYTTYDSGDIEVNTSEFNGVNLTTYYLFYPVYWSNAQITPTNFTWENVKDRDNQNVYIQPTQIGVVGTTDYDGIKSTDTFTFTRAGMYIFDSDTSHAGNDPSTYAGYIWVNGTTNYTIELSQDQVDYGSTDEITVLVKEGSTAVASWIQVLNSTNVTIVSNRYGAAGVTLDNTLLESAGDYTVRAYRDTDVAATGTGNPEHHYDEEHIGLLEFGYDEFYGWNYTGGFPIAPYAAVQYYNWSFMGPWDPPEKNATEETFTVNTVEPEISLTNTTVYWGYQTRIDVNVTNSTGHGIVALASNLKLKLGANYFGQDDVWINSTGLGNYTIEIPRATIPRTADNWSNLGAQANGTWRVVFGLNVAGDATEEWNGSASFSVRSANPPVQLVIVNDGSGKASDKKVNVPTYTPGNGNAATINIVFDIFGRDITNGIEPAGRAYYGDDADEEAGVLDNLTIEGDILYPVDATNLIYSGTGGRWTATVTPTKPGGTITFTLDWPGEGNGTATQVIEIINGTSVTPAVEKFTVGTDYNLTVTVTDMDGALVKNAYVYLMWENDAIGEFNDTHGVSTVAGNGKNGEYTFWIQNNKKDPTHTPATAPQNITIAAKFDTGFWGYTKVVMEKNHNMRVNTTPTTSYAGDPTEYDITVDLIGGGNPSKTSHGGLRIQIYNETGDVVGGDLDIVSGAWPITGVYDINGREIVLAGGTYYLYAFNDTHDSQGNNATLVITKYTVTSTPSVLAWKIDEAVNMTFQVTPAGNGTLTLENMSALPNASSVGDDMQISIENGVGTLDEVNATTLGNVTFTYTPDGGEARPTDALLRVTTATATPSPATIYIGEASTVTITVTHPATGAPLAGVEVGLDHDLNISTTILSKLPTNAFTDAQGKVTFAITADASGNVTIFMENESDPDNEFIILATARKTMTISADPSVDETKTFTVTAKYNGVLITDATVNFVFNGQTYPTTTGSATITAPSVTTSLNYPISATAAGYSDESADIMVINVPKLTIIPPSGKIYGTQKFVITIANDAGAGVTGVKVTFNGVDYYSGANGVCELTAPDVKDKNGQTFPITATFTGYGSADTVNQKIEQTKGVPGFELLTLVAAIGVAFLLLRRRRN